jgi:hypothetical protein
MARGNRRENIVLGHLNPVRAGMIKQGQGFDESPWTSLRESRKPPTKRQPWIAPSSGFEAVGVEETSRGAQGLHNPVGKSHRLEPAKRFR